MNLKEWKVKNSEELKQEAKAFAESGDTDRAVRLVPEEILEEIKQELVIENYSEIVEDFEELDLTLEEICEETGLVEQYQFVPDEFGQKMDITIQVDESVINEKLMNLADVKDLFFAEDFDFEIDEKTGKADVTFTRASGKIQKKKTCKKGFKLKGNKCIPQTGTDKAGNKKLGLKLKKAKRAMGAGKKKKAALKAKITKKRTAGKARNFSNT